MSGLVNPTDSRPAYLRCDQGFNLTVLLVPSSSSPFSSSPSSSSSSSSLPCPPVLFPRPALPAGTGRQSSQRSDETPQLHSGYEYASDWNDRVTVRTNRIRC